MKSNLQKMMCAVLASTMFIANANAAFQLSPDDKSPDAGSPDRIIRFKLADTAHNDKQTGYIEVCKVDPTTDDAIESRCVDINTIAINQKAVAGITTTKEHLQSQSKISDWTVTKDTLSSIAGGGSAIAATGAAVMTFVAVLVAKPELLQVIKEAAETAIKQGKNLEQISLAEAAKIHRAAIAAHDTAAVQRAEMLLQWLDKSAPVRFLAKELFSAEHKLASSLAGRSVGSTIRMMAMTRNFLATAVKSTVTQAAENMHIATPVTVIAGSGTVVVVVKELPTIYSSLSDLVASMKGSVEAFAAIASPLTDQTNMLSEVNVQHFARVFLGPALFDTKVYSGDVHATDSRDDQSLKEYIGLFSYQEVVTELQLLTAVADANAAKAGN